MSWREWPPWRKRQKDQARAAKKEGERERHQAVLAAIHSIADELTTERQRQDAEDHKKASREKWTIGGLFVAAAVAIAALVVSGYQAYLTRRSITDADAAASQQHSDTEVALSRAHDANDLLRKQSDLMQKQMQLGERAWLSVTMASTPPIVGKVMNIRIITINSGKTYALKVSDCTGYVPIHGPPYSVSTTPPAFGKCSGFKQADLIAPNSYWTQEAATPTIGLTQTDVDRFSDGEDVIWYFGKVTYQDIFGCWHWVKFCYVRQVPSKEEGAVWRNCPTRNEADDANVCEKRP